MARVRVIGAVAATMASVAAAFIFSASRDTSEPSAKPQRILFYRCPMHPSNVSKAPGTSDCGMALVPVYEDTHSSSGGTSPVVSVTPERQQLSGLRLTTVEKAAVTATIRTLGRVAVDETRDFRVTAGADGWITAVHTEATTGSTVRAGQPLATVSGREYTTAQRAFLYAIRTLETAQKAPQTSQPLEGFGQGPKVLLEEARLDLKRLGLSDKQIEEIQAARDVQLNIALTSPASGVLLSRNAYTQQGFTSGTELFRVADLRRVWILADMSGDGASHVSGGTGVNVTLPDRPDLTFRATVAEAVPLFNGETRTLKVRLEVDNPRLVLRPDMFVDLEFSTRMPESLSVAADAVRESGLRKTVFVKRADGSFEPRDVETGWRSGDRVQILKGLTAGDVIVESGNFLIDSESRLRSADSAPHD